MGPILFGLKIFIHMTNKHIILTSGSVHIYTQSHTFIHTHSRAFIPIHTHLHTFTRIYTHTHAFTHIHTHLYTFTRIYTHIHTFTRTLSTPLITGLSIYKLELILQMEQMSNIQQYSTSDTAY